MDHKELLHFPLDMVLAIFYDLKVTVALTYIRFCILYQKLYFVSCCSLYQNLYFLC